MLRESGLITELEEYAKEIDGQVMHLYGDQAYPLTCYIMSLFKGKVFFRAYQVACNGDKRHLFCMRIFTGLVPKSATINQKWNAADRHRLRK